MILGIRTDKPESELWLGRTDGMVVEVYKWEAHRQLAETIHIKIDELLQRNGLELKDLSGVVGYLGPGSFTGLRIGLSVANALAYGLNIPITGGEGDEWMSTALPELADKPNEPLVPNYGAPVHITEQKK